MRFSSAREIRTIVARRIVPDAVPSQRLDEKLHATPQPAAPQEESPLGKKDKLTQAHGSKDLSSPRAQRVLYIFITFSISLEAGHRALTPARPRSSAHLVAAAAPSGGRARMGGCARFFSATRQSGRNHENDDAGGAQRSRTTRNAHQC